MHARLGFFSPYLTVSQKAILGRLDEAMRVEDRQATRELTLEFLRLCLELTREAFLEFWPALDLRTFLEIRDEDEDSDIVHEFRRLLWNGENLSPFAVRLLAWHQGQLDDSELMMSVEDLNNYLVASADFYEGLRPICPSGESDAPVVRLLEPASPPSLELPEAPEPAPEEQMTVIELNWQPRSDYVPDRPLADRPEPPPPVIELQSQTPIPVVRELAQTDPQDRVEPEELTVLLLAGPPEATVWEGSVVPQICQEEAEPEEAGTLFPELEVVEEQESVAGEELPVPRAGMLTPEPVEQVVSAEPVEQVVSAEPVEQVMSAEPVEQVVSAEPVEQVMSAEPVEQVVSAEPVEQVMSAEPVEQVVSAEPVEQATPDPDDFPIRTKGRPSLPDKDEGYEVLPVSASPLSPLERKTQLIVKKKYLGYGKNSDGVMGYCGQLTLSRFDDSALSARLECSNPLLFLSSTTPSGKAPIVTYWMPPAAFPQPSGHLTISLPDQNKVLSVGSLFPQSRTDFLTTGQVLLLMLSPSILGLLYFCLVYLLSAFELVAQVKEIFPEAYAAALGGSRLADFRSQGVGLYQLEVVPASESLQLIWAALIWICPILATKFFRHLSRARQRELGGALAGALLLPSMGLFLIWTMQRSAFPLFEHPDFAPLALRHFLPWSLPLNLAVAIYLFLSVHGLWDRVLRTRELRLLLPVVLSGLYLVIGFLVIFGRSWLTGS